ncbi:F-box/kelch-repeat protein At3g06240-like [Andrographis paniculata]|uniref:F-box/kelch-repeat protein At3g06240-like n=1 Tax=Andrographis paniculata TaxID=175694 RepID=UPI0021E8DFC4|nr:F-box/kelch-repeat protein At3g06240-like [Andrographis paniculata]
MYLPDDLIFEILSWLPPETLIRLRIVCKLWYSTIGDSKFISKHQSNFRRSKNNIGRIVIPGRESIRFGFINIHEALASPDEHNLSAIFGNWDAFEGEEEVLRWDIHGFCNGVFCCSKSGVSDHNRRLFVCNPCIRRWISFPDTYNSPDYYVHYGVGYDSEINDHKIVKIIGHGRSAQVFSLKLNSWREIEPPARTAMIYGESIYMSGFIHWLCEPYSSRRYVILLFDVVKEVFGEMELAIESDLCSSNVGARIADADGLLSVMTLKTIPDLVCEVWTMNEYGGVWIHRLRQQPPCHKMLVSIVITIGCKIFMCLSNFIPLVFIDGELRYLKRNDLIGTLIVLDLETPDHIYTWGRRLPNSGALAYPIEPTLQLLDCVATDG